MQKILELTSKDFLTGLSHSAHIDNNGLFSSATGICPYINPFSSGNQLGLLQGGPALQTRTVADNPWANVVEPTGTPYMYEIGDAGHLYRQTISSDADPTDLRAATPITNPAAGICIFQPNGGTKKLYYFQLTQIGTWDMAGTYPTGWTDNAYTGLQSTTIHPCHYFNGAWYYGNKDRIGKISDDGAAGVTHSTNVLDFPSEWIATTISDDGTYLIVGLTRNTVSGAATVKAENKVIFWDTFSSSWNKEQNVYEESIDSIRSVAGSNLGLAGLGLYSLNYQSKPRRLVTLTPADAMSVRGGAVPTHYAATVFNDNLAWITDGAIQTYGRITPGSPVARFAPVGGTLTGNSSLVHAYYVKLHIGSKFVSFGNGGGTGAAKTVYFHLPTEVRLDAIDVFLGEPLVSGDAFDIDILTDEDTAAIDWGSASFSADGAIRRKTMSSSKITHQFKLVANFTAGNPKIKTIVIWGTPTK